MPRVLYMITFDIQKLDRERIRQGLKKSKLARMIDVQPSTISAVWSGTNRSPETLKAICDALSISIEEIMIEEPERQPAA